MTNRFLLMSLNASSLNVTVDSQASCHLTYQKVIYFTHLTPLLYLHCVKGQYYTTGVALKKLFHFVCLFDLLYYFNSFAC